MRHGLRVAAVMAIMVASSNAAAQWAIGNFVRGETVFSSRGGVTGAEGTLTLPTYPWGPDDVNPRFAELEGSIIYPYTMQDNLSAQKVDRTYKALILENKYLRVTCLPELGGRIHSVLDKTGGQPGKEMFHLNQVIKPGLIAMRGAWISGGIEWNPGPHGHTVTIVSPVDATVGGLADGSGVLVIGNTDQILGTRWTVSLILRPDKAYLEEHIRIFNPTDGYHPYYFWNNTAFPCRPGTRYIYPMNLGTDHFGRTFFSWPVHEGRDMTWLKNYQDMTSTFAYGCVHDFFGAYDVDADRGIVQYANHGILPGKKAWTWGQADFGLVSQESLTDEDGPYIEVQSGPLATQSDYEFLAPRQQVSWEEWWLPVHGLVDGFEYATKDAVFNTKRAEKGLEVRVLVTGDYPGSTFRIAQGEKALLEKAVDLTPQEPAVFTVSPAPEGPVTVTVTNNLGEVLGEYESPLPIPQVEPPTFPEPKGDEDLTTDEMYAKALRFDKDTNASEARAGYERVLAEKDPDHAPSLQGLAVLELEQGRYEEAAKRLARVVELRSDNSMAWALLGLARLRQGRFDEAIENGYRAVRLIDAAVLGYDVVGRARAQQGEFEEAAKAFERATQVAPQDLRAHDRLLLAWWGKGDIEWARKEAEKRAQHDPLALIPRIVLRYTGTGDRGTYRPWTFLGEHDYEMLDAALVMIDTGMRDAARVLLEENFGGKNPMALYHLAYLQKDDEAASMRALEQASALPADYVFPSFAPSVDALQYAVEHRPDDSRAHLYLGHVLAGLHRLDEAVPHWEKAAQLDAKLSVAQRLLAMHAWKKSKDLAKADALFAKAIEARPDDEILYHDRAQVLIEQNRRPEAIELLAARPIGDRARPDATLLLVRSYVDEKRYDDAITLLETSDFSNWEGQTDSWDLFNRAHVERGKLRFEAKDFEAALAEFTTAVTYPKSLRVGRPVKPREAEGQYWKGRALQALGRLDEARAAWQEGAAGPESTAVQNKHRELCSQALELLSTP